MSKLPGWSEDMTALVKTTPKDKIVDWKIIWRDPQPCWTSAGGRIVQIGDCAHTFIPTSGSGATQAMEDAISIAACLHLGGKSNIPMATKVHNKLRFVTDSLIPSTSRKSSSQPKPTDSNASPAPRKAASRTASTSKRPTGRPWLRNPNSLSCRCGSG